MTAVLAQARMEVVLTLRRGESLVVNLAIPLLVLVFFSRLDAIVEGDVATIDFLTPGVLAARGAAARARAREYFDPMRWYEAISGEPAE